MTGCSACEPVVAAAGASLSIYLWASTRTAGDTLFRIAADIATPAVDLGDGGQRWDVPAVDVDRALTAAGAALSPEERDATKTLLMDGGREPGLSDFRRVASLERAIALQSARWLSDMMAEDRLVTHFQPMIDSRAPDRIAAYECLLRGRGADGALVPPGPMFAAAKRAGLLFQLDLSARRRAVRSIAEQRFSTPAFINFTPTSIYDPATCLRSTVAAVSELGLAPERIVFEIIETEHADEALLRSILSVYRGAGFKVAIDDFGAGYSSMNLINALRPDYLKLDMQLIRDVDKDPYKSELASSLLDTARKLSITTIAEGVETRGEWEWVRDHGADLVQGFYFARPGNPPPQLNS